VFFKKLITVLWEACVNYSFIQTEGPFLLSFDNVSFRLWTDGIIEGKA